MRAFLARTVVPVIVGIVLAQAARIGLDLPEGVVTESVTVLCIGAYAALARLLEERFPSLGRWLISLGLTRLQPVYGAEAAQYVREVNAGHDDNGPATERIP